MLLTTRQLVLAALLRTCPAGWSRPAALDTLEAGLLTTLPADDGSGAVEAAGSSYARVARAPTDANWSIASDIVTNAAALSFPLLTGSIGTIVGWGLWDGAGTLRWAQPAGGLPLAFTAQAAADTLTRATHGLVDKQTVRAFALEGLPLPTGLAADTTYFVRDAATDTLKLAATEGGTAINITADGALHLRRWYGKAYGVDDRPVIPASGFSLRLTV